MDKDFEQGPGSIGRREILIGAAALATTAAAAQALAANPQAARPAGAGARYSEAAAYKKHAKAVAAAGECIETGRACLSHCFETFVAGDTMMAECAVSVQEMLHVCDAFAWLAATDSRQLAPMARACIASCEYCEKGVPRARGAPGRVQGLCRRLCGVDPRGEEAHRLRPVLPVSRDAGTGGYTTPL